MMYKHRTVGADRKRKPNSFNNDGGDRKRQRIHMSADAARAEIRRVIPNGIATEADVETWLKVMKNYWDGL